jgi:hypothetical protein
LKELVKVTLDGFFEIRNAYIYAFFLMRVFVFAMDLPGGTPCKKKQAHQAPGFAIAPRS